MANISYNEIAQSIYEASLSKEVDNKLFTKNVINFLKKRKLLSGQPKFKGGIDLSSLQHNYQIILY